MDRIALILDAIDAMRRRSERAAVAGDLLSIGKVYGFDGVLVLPLPEPGRPLRRADVDAVGWPEVWLDRYCAGRLAEADPVVAMARTAARPFLFDEAFARRSGPGVRRCLAAAVRAGISGGLAVPVTDASGRRALVAFAGASRKIEDSDLALLQVAGAAAHQRRAEIEAARRTDADGRLSPREIDCVRWAAEGKTGWEIGRILSISAHTAEWYLSSAARKLGAANRAHVVAVAFRRGLIA